MQNNFQSLSYFLPELTIVTTILFVIIADLIKDLKKYSYYISVFGLLFAGLLLYLCGYEIDPKMIFNNMLIHDSFTYYFKCIILFSTSSIIIVSKYSNELDDEYHMCDIINNRNKLYTFSFLVSYTSKIPHEKILFP